MKVGKNRSKKTGRVRKGMKERGSSRRVRGPADSFAFPPPGLRESKDMDLLLRNSYFPETLARREALALKRSETFCE